MKRCHFFAVIAVSDPVHEAVRKILPLVGKRIRTEQNCRSFGLLLIKTLHMGRKAHQLIQKVTKFVNGGFCGGYNDLAIFIVRYTNAIQISLITYACEIFAINHILPALFCKYLTDRLRNLLEFQQITIQMDALFIVQRKAFQDGRQRNGKFPGQKSIEKIRSLASGDDVCPRTGVFA